MYTHNTQKPQVEIEIVFVYFLNLGELNRCASFRLEPINDN